MVTEGYSTAASTNATSHTLGGGGGGTVKLMNVSSDTVADWLYANMTSTDSWTPYGGGNSSSSNSENWTSGSPAVSGHTSASWDDLPYLNGTELPFFNETNGTTVAPNMSTQDKDIQDFVIGLTLAVTSSIFIGTSYIFKKLGLLRYAKKVSVRAGQGGFGYLKEWMWWTGMILMTVGEFANFAAYTFAPATLVTPLGALSVIVSAVLSARVLKEKLNILGKVGCLLCVLGSTVMVIHSPKEQEVHDLAELMDKMKEPAFIVYALSILVIAVVAIAYLVPRYGQKNVLVYVTVCATLGSFTVMGCKGVGTAIKASARGHNEFTNWLTYVLLAVVIACILLQLNYLNKALDTFNTAVVTPIYYVFFTSCVITGSAILFQEFFHMGAFDIVGDICGFFTIVAGIFLLNAFKDMKISWRNLPAASKELETTDSEVVNSSATLSGTTNTNYILDCRDIEAHISRNMSTECITKTVSEDSDCNENGYIADRRHGSSPVQE